MAKYMFKRNFRNRGAKSKRGDTSWEQSNKWYNKLVGKEGHYYHQHVVVPGVLKLMKLKAGDSVLDIGAGQGILARHLPREVSYHGIDAAPSLVKAAKLQDRNPKHEYTVADATLPLPISKKDFTYATALFSLQNMEHPEHAIAQVAKHLNKDGKFVFVLNHPAFRIPRQSGWGISENKQQHRWVTRYMTPMQIPIEMHPGMQKSEKTLSFHQPLSAYSTFLFNAGFVIEKIEEWISDKKNQPGPHAKREDMARSEIPLFMAIVALKK